MNVFLCEESIDGIFSGVYDAWDSRLGHNNIRLMTLSSLDSYSLFCDYIEVPVNSEKSQKVAQTLIRRLGQEVYQQICQAICALDTPSGQRSEWNKADAVYKTIVLGLSLKDGRKVMDFLGEPYVNRVFKLSLSAFNEAHHMLGFLRFSELANGILFARVHPKHDILPFLAEHFTDRLPQEDFLIFDENRETAAVHKKGKHFILAEVPKADMAYMTNYSQNELEYRRLWLGFFHSISIEARCNPNLQRQNIAKRFWKDTVELEPFST